VRAIRANAGRGAMEPPLRFVLIDSNTRGRCYMRTPRLYSAHTLPLLAAAESQSRP
jgi:hypothetical protein